MTTTNCEPPKEILVLSLSKHLTGHPIAKVIDEDWQKADATTQTNFHNVGFDVNAEDFGQSLKDLRGTIQTQTWDAILIGWCMRGYPERTVWFESMVEVCVEELRSLPNTKLVFNTGPEDILAATLRNFPQ